MRLEPAEQLFGRAHVPEVHETDALDVDRVGVVDQRRHLLLGELRAETKGWGWGAAAARAEVRGLSGAVRVGAVCDTYNQACSVNSLNINIAAADGMPALLRCAEGGRRLG